MKTTCCGLGSRRYAPSRARILWLATAPIGWPSPRASMRTSSERTSFIGTRAYQNSQRDSAKLRDRLAEHALEARENPIRRRDPGPFEVEDCFGAARQG